MRNKTEYWLWFLNVGRLGGEWVSELGFPYLEEGNFEHAKGYGTGWYKGDIRGVGSDMMVGCV